MTMTPEEEKQLEIALATRNFEIELFWKRSVFFWGFISVAFAGYGAFKAAHSDLAIVVACFGMVCSTAWTLLNRGSKFWQENWEQKVLKYARGKTLFAEQEPVEKKGAWQAQRYSVSKLLIALSDYVFAIWIVLVGWETYELKRHFTCSAKDVGIATFIGMSVLYVVLLLIFGRTTSEKKKNKTKTSTPVSESEPDDDPGFRQA